MSRRDASPIARATKISHIAAKKNTKTPAKHFSM
jgi:hypothetical protein